MGFNVNLVSKIAGLVGVCVISHRLYKWFKLHQNDKDNFNEIHQVFFINPLCEPEKCKRIKCHGSKCDSGDIFNAISGRIDEAKYTIDLAIYVITCYQIADAIVNAHKRGVKVRVIADNSLAHSTGSQISKIMKVVPMQLFHCQDGLMHHKFCLIDAPQDSKTPEKKDKESTDDEKSVKIDRKSILITGSLNWTMRGAVSNCENVIITSNRAIIRDFQNEFQRIWMHLSAYSSL
ncbi:hypothetical protein DMENIID0001_039260 [Sergentomyia squamirostris]